MAAKPDFDDVYAKLRAILHRHAKALDVKTDAPGRYHAETTAPHPLTGKPVLFGGARTGKSYVSFYLFPVYTHPELLEGISPALRKRMQGKSCFNFRDADRVLLAELAALTKRGYDRYVKEKLIG